MSINNNIDKDKEIKKEISRLNKIFKDLEGNKKRVAEGLINEAAFMRMTLDELKKDINANGIVTEMPQGTYSITRESPASKAYTTMIQRYSNVIKELMALLPKELPKQEDDGFEDFVDNK